MKSFSHFKWWVDTHIKGCYRIFTFDVFWIFSRMKPIFHELDLLISSLYIRAISSWWCCLLDNSLLNQITWYFTYDLWYMKKLLTIQVFWQMMGSNVLDREHSCTMLTSSLSFTITWHKQILGTFKLKVQSWTMATKCQWFLYI